MAEVDRGRGCVLDRDERQPTTGPHRGLDHTGMGAGAAMLQHHGGSGAFTGPHDQVRGGGTLRCGDDDVDRRVDLGVRRNVYQGRRRRGGQGACRDSVGGCPSVGQGLLGGVV